LTQEIFPHIPLTIEDAVYKYKIAQNFSIEWRQKTYSPSFFKSHVLGQFYKATRRPITREMVLACMEPYRRLVMFSPNQIKELKNTFPEKIQVCMGIDWGSGAVGASQTVVSILLKWRGVIDGQYSQDRDRYYLTWIERRGQENSIEQAQHMRDLFEDYSCDFGVADLGYGEIQVDAMINGGANPKTGERFDGLGHHRFIGSWTRKKITETEKDVPFKYDEEGNEEITHLLVDKSHIIQNFVDFVDWKVTHPLYPSAETLARSKLIIPFGEEGRVDFLIKDLTSITRRDLEADLTSEKEDSRQQAQKLFNHPPDSTISLIYALVADQYYSQKRSGEFLGTWSLRRKKIHRTYSRNNGVNPLFRGTRSL